MGRPKGSKNKPKKRTTRAISQDRKRKSKQPHEIAYQKSKKKK